MAGEEMEAKWDRIYSALPETEPQPVPLLLENAHLLPPQGDALDLACGLGGNAVFLARRGLRVSAWDISSVAIARLASLSERLGLAVQAKARKVEVEPFPREAFDVVVVSRFLLRELAVPILDSLRSGGLLFYQTYVRDKVTHLGPGNKDYLLEENELLEMFKGMRLLVYREEGRVGDLAEGRRDEAYFIGRKQKWKKYCSCSGSVSRD